MAFIDGGMSTAKNIVKDLTNVFVFANAKMNPTITDEPQIVKEATAGVFSVKLLHPLLNNTIIFKRSGGVPFVPTYNIVGQVIVFTDVIPMVAVSENILITYDGDRDWNIVYPLPRTVDDEDNPLTTAEEIKLDQISRITEDIGDIVILSTTTTRNNIELSDSLGGFVTDANLSTESLVMYLEINKPSNVLNPEDGAVSYRFIDGTTDKFIQMVNNYYFNMRIFDKINPTTGLIANDAKSSEWVRYNWFIDFKESLVDDYDATSSTGLVSAGYYFRPIVLPEFYNDGGVAIQYWVNCNNDRIHIVLMGNPDVNPNSYLTSWAYIGRLDLFKNKTADEPYYNDVIGNFAITAGSATIPSKSAIALTEPIGQGGSIDITDAEPYFLAETTGGAGTLTSTLRIPIKYVPTDNEKIFLSTNLNAVWYMLDTTDFEVNTDDPDSMYILLIGKPTPKFLPGSAYKLIYPVVEDYAGFYDSLSENITGAVNTRTTAYKITFKSTQIETAPIFARVSFYGGLQAKVGSTKIALGGTPDPTKNPSTTTHVITPKLTINLPESGRENIVGIKVYKLVTKITKSTLDQASSGTTFGLYNPLPEEDDETQIYKSFTYDEYDIEVTGEDITNGYVEYIDNNFNNIAAGSQVSLLARRSDNGTPSIVRDPTTKRVLDVIYPDTYGAKSTATGVIDISMYMTKMGTYFQKHSVAFTSYDEFLTKERFNPSRWTNKYHLSNIYVVHSGDGYRGFLSDVVTVDNDNIMNGDILIVNEGSTDPNNPEVRYRYFKINAPYRCFDFGPNYATGIAIKME